MDGFQSLRCLRKCLHKTLQYIVLKFLNKQITLKKDTLKSQFFISRVCVCVCVSHFWDPLIKRPIMDRFQSLRCLWKCLDKTLQSLRCLWKHLNKTIQYIMLKFLKSNNFTKKIHCKTFKKTFIKFMKADPPQKLTF